MPRRVKEEEKIEMIIRSLLKQPDNSRCINCNSSGPQYVCTTFWTFVCTSCSGVHREFNHRVKSASMSKFNEEEIMALQAGGNERAKQIYFKTWDPKRHTYPDGGDLQKIREFVNHVYVDRRYAGRNSSKLSSTVNLDSRSNSCEWRPEKPSRGRKDDIVQRNSSSCRGWSDKSGSSNDNSCGGSFEKSSSSSSRVLNLKEFLEERSPRSRSLRSRSTHFEIVDDRFKADGSAKTYGRRESRSGSMSPRAPCLPTVRPIKDPPRASDGRDTESYARAEQIKSASSSSLIDLFDAEPELFSKPMQPMVLPMESNANNRSSSTASSSAQAAANVPNMNSADALLLEWSSPVPSPSASFGTENNSYGTLSNTFTKNDQQSLHSYTDNHIVQEIPMHQQWNKSPPSNDQRPVPSVPVEQLPQGVGPGEGPVPSTRKEIPEDLFTSNFTEFNPAVGGWPIYPPHGAGYGLQFHTPALPAAVHYPEPSKPRNPFEDGDDGFQVPMIQKFPSMPSLQGALPNMPLECQPYATALASQSHMSPYGMNVPLAYRGQIYNNMPITRPQGTANFGRNEDVFASLNPIQQTSGVYQSSLSPGASISPLPRLGDPFG